MTATNIYPAPGDRVILRDSKGNEREAAIEQAYGMYRFVAGLRFHVRDDRTSEGAWALPARPVTVRLAP